MKLNKNLKLEEKKLYRRKKYKTKLLKQYKNENKNRNYKKEKLIKNIDKKYNSISVILK